MIGMTWLECVLLGLSTWRLAVMIQKDWGPLLIFERFRFLVGCRRAGEDLWHKPMPGSICDGVLCIYCLSVWCSVPFLVLWLYLPGYFELITAPLWASALSILFNRASGDEGPKKWEPEEQEDAEDAQDQSPEHQSSPRVSEE